MLPTDCLFIRKVGKKKLFRLIRRSADGSEIIKGEYADRLTALRALHEYYHGTVTRAEIMVARPVGGGDDMPKFNERSKE